MGSVERAMHCLPPTRLALGLDPNWPRRALLALGSLLAIALGPAASAQDPVQDPAQEPIGGLGKISPLVQHVADCERGRSLLFELAEHISPPRHRMGVEVHVAAKRLFHSPRPGMHREAEESQRIRVFAGPATPAGPGARVGSERLWGLDLEITNLRRAGAEPAQLALRRTAFKKGSALREGDVLRAQLAHRAAVPGALISFLIDRGRVLCVTDSNHDGDHDEETSTQILMEFDGGRVLVRTVPVAFGEDSVPGLVGVDWVTHDDLLGDVVESLTYASAPPAGPGVVGGWTIEGPMGSVEVATVRSVEPDTRARPVDPAGWPAADDPPVQVDVSPLGQNALELRIPQSDARSIAVDLGPGWAVLEAPVRSGTGEAMLAALETEKPGHPVLYAAASHHHPHYIGGLRPFAASGATIVCPEGVARYVEHVLKRPRTIQADRLALSGRDIEVIGVPYAERWAPPEAPGRLVAVEAGGRSQHTEAFMVFVLPELRLGFGGDLLWVPANTPPEETPLNPRTRGLALILSGASDLPVDEYLTSWPVKESPTAGRAWLDRVPVSALPAVR